MPSRKHRPASSFAAPRSATATPPETFHPGAARTAALLFFGLLAVYCSNLRVMGAGDSLPSRVLPFSILREGDLDLDEFTWELTRNGRWPYYLHGTGGHMYSVSTIATPIVVAPLYVLPAWLLAHYGIAYDDVRARVLIVVMERLSAATLTALSAVLVFLTLDRMVSRRAALALAVTYGCGTSAFSISSQALWPHALAALALAVLSFIFLSPRPNALAVGLAGTSAALAVANRPAMIVFAVLAALHVWRHERRHLIAFAALPVAGAAALLAYNLSIFRAWVGSYQTLGHFSPQVFQGVLGLFVSPNRGLFVYTPVMLFAFWGGLRVWRQAAPPWMRLLVVGIVAHVLIYGAFTEWWAGYTYGPRYFTDVLPGLTLLLAYGLVPLWPVSAVRALAVPLAVYGAVVQAIGVYFADDDWNRSPVPVERRPARVWDWSDLQIARALSSPWKGTDLAPLLADVIRAGHPAMLEPLAADDLAAAIEIAERPSALRPGETRTLDVTVTNRGAKAWPAFSGDGRINVRYLVVLMVRWFANGQTVGGDVFRLPVNVEPKETISTGATLVAPARPGRYAVEVRVTQAIDGTRGTIGPDALRFAVDVN